MNSNLFMYIISSLGMEITAIIVLYALKFFFIQCHQTSFRIFCTVIGLICLNCKPVDGMERKRNSILHYNSEMMVKDKHQ